MGGPFLCAEPIQGAAGGRVAGRQPRRAECLARGSEPGGAPRVLGKAIRSPPPRPALRRLRDGLEPVLAEGGEVDQKIGGVGEPRGELSASSIHGWEGSAECGQNGSFAGVLASQARIAVNARAARSCGRRAQPRPALRGSAPSRRARARSHARSAARCASPRRAAGPDARVGRGARRRR